MFRRIPAVFNDRWARDGAIFYSMPCTVIACVGSDALAEWLCKQGVDPARFEQTLKSFGVQPRVRRAKQLTVSYGIEGVPYARRQRALCDRSGARVPGNAKAAEKLIAAARKEAAAK